MSLEVCECIRPRVVPVGTEVDIGIEECGHPPVLLPGTDLTVRCFSKVDRQDDSTVAVRTHGDGILRVRLPFRARGEYTLDIRSAGEDNTENNPAPPPLSAKCFAVSGELARLRPYKGDVHLHTTGSDGKNTPSEMLIGARAAGMDFVAVTDHDNHAPSVQAAGETAELGAGPVVLRGEEVTIAERGGHILALAAGDGVGRRRFSEAVGRACAESAAGQADRSLVGPLTPQAYAHALWTVNEVHEAGGIALMAHPYWEGSRGKFYPPRCIFEQLLQDGLLDGVELIGGSPDTEGNLLCVARYAEGGGSEGWAIVGGSDAHAVDDIGRKFTLLFAEHLSERDIVNAILARRSVACDTCLGPDVAVFGRFELVEYAYFLLREYFPEHDRLCAARAALCSPAAAGTATAERDEAARALDRDLEAWYDAFFSV